MMLNTIPTIIRALMLLVAMTALPAFAKQAFTEQGFEQAQAANELVLIDVYATWCPTCKKQSKVLDAYFSEYPDSKLKVLVVDFDKQKDWVSFFKAPRQSTLLLYRGEEQLWFSVAETNKERIFARLREAEQASAAE
ncbi:thioredoxin family protein [Rheinheimera baltica]|uniref:thioredoxin family protein n=1 Tax=Rheinheimera baltica TaxID=67576 RepID=UPI00273D4BF0|nr:thioredoxin family protein [Rheinheimera baltica]MDP5142885.1 thioredoxin family protein [Rheinheimera baltica]